MRYLSLPRAARALAATFALVTAAACTREYPSRPETAVTIEPIDWPDTLTETDTVTLRVRIRDASGATISGTPVIWTSSDPATMEVTVGSSADSSLEGRLTAQLHAGALARRTGTVTVSVTTSDAGPLAHAQLQKTLIVSEHWTTISAGYFHTCGTTIRNEAFCWGGGLKFLGNGSSAGSIVPSKVIGGIPFGTVSAGWEQSCGGTLDGQLYCWGYNPFGALGNGTTLDQFAPVAVTFGVLFKSFAAGFGYSCGISFIDTAVCWGDDSFGQLGTAGPFDACGAAKTPCKAVPDLVLKADRTPLTARAISPAEAHTCALSLDNAAFCWGANTRGNLGTGTTASSIVPVRVAGATTFISISAGPYHTCAIAVDGHAYCWGTNLFGELGSALASDSCDGLPCSRTPVPVGGTTLFRSISVRGRSSCALSADSLAYCWGLNDHGQLGIASSPASCAGSPCATAPMRVDGLGKIRMISEGDRHTCAITVGGRAYCWGQNTDGRLGSGTLTDSPRILRVKDPQ